MAEQPPPEKSMADGLSLTELMERKLLTERGRRLYKIRDKTVDRLKMLAALTSLWGEDLRLVVVSGRWYALRIISWSCGEAVRPAGFKKKAVFIRFDVQFCLIFGKKTITYEKLRKAFGEQRIEPSVPDSHRIRKSLCNRLYI